MRILPSSVRKSLSRTAARLLIGRAGRRVRRRCRERVRYACRRQSAVAQAPGHAVIERKPTVHQSIGSDGAGDDAGRSSTNSQPSIIRSPAHWPMAYRANGARPRVTSPAARRTRSRHRRRTRRPARRSTSARAVLDRLLRTLDGRILISFLAHAGGRSVAQYRVVPYRNMKTRIDSVQSHWLVFGTDAIAVRDRQRLRVRNHLAVHTSCVMST